MTQRRSDPDRLHLRRWCDTATYFIVYRQRKIGQFSAIPIRTRDGFIDPPILLEKKFSEQLQDRIRDMVNRLLGTNRDIVIKTPPRHDHPAIQRYLKEKMLRW